DRARDLDAAILEVVRHAEDLPVALAYALRLREEVEARLARADRLGARPPRLEQRIASRGVGAREVAYEGQRLVREDALVLGAERARDLHAIRNACVRHLLRSRSVGL